MVKFDSFILSRQLWKEDLTIRDEFLNNSKWEDHKSIAKNFKFVYKIYKSWGYFCQNFKHILWKMKPENDKFCITKQKLIKNKESQDSH